MTADRYLRFEKVRRPPSGRPLLWPVRVWRVVYPYEHSKKRLNLFQLAILGLARARCQDTSEMADLLGLDRELVADIIAKQLIPSGWMTTSGFVTPKGESVLEKAEYTSQDVRMGYVYQDAISGNCLPRFTEELPEIEPKRIDERGYPIFLRNRDSGKEDRPFRLSPLSVDELDREALFDAFKRYQLDYDRAKQQDVERPTQISIDSIDFIENASQAMWLWTWVFPDKAESQPWLVADPFGLQQAASWLRKPLQEILPQNNAAARYIADAIGQTRPTDVSAEEWLRSLENQTDFNLLVDYSWLQEQQIKEYLTGVLRIRALLENQEKSWQENITSLLIETNNLVESVFQWLLRKYKPNIKSLPHWKTQRDWKPGQAQHCLQILNIQCITDDVIKRLSTQPLNNVRSAITKGSNSPKALLFASLLATCDNADHPFLSLSADKLQLTRILDMADARNKKAGHSGIEKIDKVDAIEYADFVIDWIQNFKEWY